jgi:predicted TIM-barrel fold metal-dependent hydrolase
MEVDMKKLLLVYVLIVAVSAVVFVIGSRCRAAVDSTQVFVIETPKSYPAVDVHTHMSAVDASYELAMKTMDAAGIAVTVNLAGGSGESLAKHLALGAKYPGRFIQFCGVRLSRDQWQAPDVGEKIATSIQESHDLGAAGFGEIVKWALNRRINWDDPRLDPVWSKLEELKMPINWHVGDPSRYWRPEGPFNTLETESYHGRMPLKQELLNQQERVLERHPNLVVIAAHSNYLTDMIPLLVWRFEKYPNYYVDLSASIEEWGRVPEEFVDVALEYQDRMLYGTDGGYRDRDIPEGKVTDAVVANLKSFHVAHFLFLGTKQRMIPTPFDGNYGRYLIGWKNGYTRYAHDGVALPDDVLQKIYFKNAEKLFKISVADWKPASPVSFETKGEWQQRVQGGRGARDEARIESTASVLPGRQNQ